MPWRRTRMQQVKVQRLSKGKFCLIYSILTDTNITTEKDDINIRFHYSNKFC